MKCVLLENKAFSLDIYGNLVLQLHTRGVVKHDFQLYPMMHLPK